RTAASIRGICVSTTSAARPPNSTASSPALRTSMQSIANALSEAASAWACYLALADRAGQTPRLVVSSRPAEDLPAWRELDGPAWVRPALSKREALVVQAGDWPALALPLIRDERLIGVALLLYTNDMLVDVQRASAAAGLTACALDSARQIAAPHFQAEEIE